MPPMGWLAWPRAETPFQHSTPPSSAEVRAEVELGYRLSQHGRHEEALAAFDSALELDPKNASVHWFRGNALCNLGRYKDALTAIDNALRLEPKHVRAHFLRGFALGHLGRDKEALANFDRAIRLNAAAASLKKLGRDQEAPLLCNRAIALRRLERYDEALTAYDLAIRFDPDNAEMHRDRGTTLAELKRYGDALNSFTAAINLAPNDAPSHFGRAMMLAGLNRFEEAVTAYDRAIDLDFNYPVVHLNRGFALSNLERFDEAVAAFDRASSIDPDFALARKARQSTLELKAAREALAEIERAQATPENSAAISDGSAYNPPIDDEIIKPTETGTTGEKEGLMQEPLRQYLETKNVPESIQPELAAEIDNLVAAKLSAVLRPKWDERGKYAELKDLSAPAFLKRVYADEFGADGSIRKAAIRKADPKLVGLVESYISEREKNKKSMGAADGIKFLTSPAGRPKRLGMT